MKKKWRIKKVSRGYGVNYILQKRFLGFLWWYNPDNFDGSSTGVYYSLEQAKEVHRMKTMPTTTEYIEI